MNTLNNDDRFYLAGLIDGDGSIIAQMVPRPDYVYRFQIRVTVQITQRKKRRHHLEDIQKSIGCGTLRDRGDMSDFVLTEARLVYALLKQIAPCLRIKRKQANLVIKILEQLPSSKGSALLFVDLCRLADRVAELNDSKGREITTQTVIGELCRLQLLAEVESAEDDQKIVTSP